MKRPSYRTAVLWVARNDEPGETDAQLEERSKKMRLNHYQQEASRTLPPNTEPGKALNLGALGLGGEAGEAIDLIKKHLFHGQPLDVEKLRKELGDVLWYVSAIATGAGLTLEEVAEANVEKLRKRYPEGFSPAASVARADEAGREDA